MNNDNKEEIVKEFGEYYYQRAIAKFESCEYEEAVECFIKAYEAGVFQEEIINLLYFCFILPNEDEFKKNYQEAADGITTFPYDGTEIDFIPVAENRYYMFNNNDMQFCGIFELPVIGNRERKFHSLLVSDVWDLREVTQRIVKNEYATLYYVLNDQKSKFYSFLKIPGVSEVFLKNAVCFENTEIMELFFKEYSQYYLPKTVMGRNAEYYKSVIMNISDNRNKDMNAERDNVFLTIGIPSYNRGHILVNNIKHMLQMVYDFEIEIVVSDNGSTENVEGYQEIRDMKDSRIKYVRLAENQGYAANVLNVLKHSTGRFIMLASDEDVLILEQMEALFNLIYQNITKGIISVTGYGKNFAPPEEIEEKNIAAGGEAVWKSMNTNYVTGMIYNRDVIKGYNILELCNRLSENMYVQYYTHMAISVLVTQYVDFYDAALPVWIEGEPCEAGGDIIKGDNLLNYMQLESRLSQFEAGMSLIELMYGRNNVYEWLFIRYLNKTYYLLIIARILKREAFEKEYIWKEVCNHIYEYSKNKAQKEQLHENVKKAIDDMYVQYLDR